MKIEPIKEVTGLTVTLDSAEAFNLSQGIGYVWEAMESADVAEFKANYPQFNSTLDAFQSMLGEAIHEFMFKPKPQMKEGQ